MWAVHIEVWLTEFGLLGKPGRCGVAGWKAFEITHRTSETS
jgi:hypothetical protein